MELIQRTSAGGGPVLESAALLHTFRELPAPVPRRGDHGDDGRRRRPRRRRRRRRGKRVEGRGRQLALRVAGERSAAERFGVSEPFSTTVGGRILDRR